MGSPFKKTMFKVVFFIESTEDKWSLGPKIWRYYMNWFTAHEEAAFEILGIHYLKPSHRPMTYYKHEDYEKYDDDRREKEKFDSEIFDEGIKQAAVNFEKDLKILFIY